MEYKKSKNDIELNIMVAIAILSVVIFFIVMIVTIINVYKKNKENNEKNTSQSISEYKEDEESETESNDNSNENNNVNNISNINTTVSNNTSNTNTTVLNNTDPNTSLNNNSNTNNISNTNTEVKESKYSSEESTPFKITGGKIVEGDLTKGLTIQDSNGNQWVWIEVPKSVTKKTNTEEEIEKALEEYTKKDISGNNLMEERNGCKDVNYQGTGLTDEQYLEKKSIMLQSIKSNGGFYIGKYETGYELAQGTNPRSGNKNDLEYQINERPVIKKDVYPYNWVNCKQAEKLTESLATGGKTTSLLFGIQWDLVLKYINSKGMKPYYLIENSTRWGNYSNNGEKTMLKTGNDKYTSPLGIYDLAGNVWEWTLENHYALSTTPSVVRGGDFNSEGSTSPVAYRGSVKMNLSSGSIGFRCALY